MIPLLTRAEARAVDAHAGEVLGVPSIVLMENAGAGATRVLLDRLGGLADRALLLGGPGQNGGDAWVVARHLANAGLRPTAALLGEESKLRGDAKTNFATMRKMGVDIHVVSPGDPALAALLIGAGVVVDGLFGTGLDRPVEGPWADSVRALLDSGCPVLSLDIPSGVDCDTGAIHGVAVQAVVTATFVGHKRGLHQHPGADRAGEVVRVGIGVPPSGDEIPAQLFEPADVAALLPCRALDAHKGTAGHVLAVAGSPGKTGAAALVGMGALRGGAGLVTLATRAEARRALDRKVLELMTATLSEDPALAVAEAVGFAEGMRAVVVGPGLGLDAWGRAVALALAETVPVPTVLDADALTALADAGLERLREAPAPRVLTPHPGEAGRLLGESAAAVQADRYGAALDLADRSGAVVVLKGARTVVASPGRAIRVCRYGTPALAAAGTGDVLSGVVAAQLATLGAFPAAAVAVLLHARAGELRARSDRGLLAREVAEGLPEALEACRA